MSDKSKIKAIESILKQIEIHLDKFHNFENQQRYTRDYRRDEINLKFMTQLEKTKKRIVIPTELEEKILLITKQIHDINSISLN